MKFNELGLSEEILQAIDEQGYDTPSPIQEKSIPVILDGKDIMAAAQTGTGKTAGFTLPMLELLLQGQSKGRKRKPNQARALVLTPTRELAAQVAASVETYGKHLSLNSTVVFGGVKINPQMQRLRGGVDILIATPGRLLDLHNQKAVKFNNLEILVLDEADRMLDMGFIHDIRKIMNVLPAKRQNLLFSATFSDEVRKLAKTIVNQPVEVSVSPPNSTVDTVKQSLIPAEKSDKSQILTHLIKDRNWHQVLVFSRTKHGANKLVKQLIGRKIEAAAIHGNKSQGARTRALADFKASKTRVLVATDIAARGIDISSLPYVVNYDLPQVAEDYVHRIGRTGRAGAKGEAVSLVSHDEFKQLRDIERLIKKVIPRETLEGFEPLNKLPDSNSDFKPAKNKKTHKPNKGRKSSNFSRGSTGGGGNRSGKGSGNKSGSGEGNNGNNSGNNSGNRNPNQRNRQSSNKKVSKQSSSNSPYGNRNS